jgi:hypothetical protein
MTEPDLSPLPDDGVFTKDQLALARQWVASHWTSGACPFHGPTTWEIDSRAAHVPAGGLFTGRVFTCFVLTCGTCKWTVFINAVTANVVARRDPPGEAESTEAEEAKPAPGDV